MSESITVDTELLDGPIVCEDLSGLRGFVRRGSNRILPGAPGRRRSTLILDQLDETLTFLVNGITDPAGTPHADMQVGVEANLEHYRSLFYPNTPHALELSFAGSVFTGDAQIPEYDQIRTGPWNATIIARFIVTAGELEETGS